MAILADLGIDKDAGYSEKHYTRFASKNKPMTKLSIDLDEVDKDISGLTTLEAGAYIRLILRLHQVGSLPEDDVHLRAIARVQHLQWTKMKPAVMSALAYSISHIGETVDKSKRLSQFRSAIAKQMQSNKPKQAPVLDEEKMTALVRQQIIGRFERRGLTPPDHMSMVGILVGMGYSSQAILSAVDYALEQRHEKFTSMNQVHSFLSIQKEKLQPSKPKEEKDKESEPGGRKWWDVLLSCHAKNRTFWQYGYASGDMPGNPGCLAPADLLEKYNLPPTPPYPHDKKKEIKD